MKVIPQKVTEDGYYDLHPYDLAISDLLLEIDDLPPTAKLFLIVIEIGLKLKDGTVCMCLGYLADCLGCSKKTVRTTQKLLVERGLLIVTEIEGDIGAHYTINYDNIPDAEWLMIPGYGE